MKRLFVMLCPFEAPRFPMLLSIRLVIDEFRGYERYDYDHIDIITV